MARAPEEEPPDWTQARFAGRCDEKNAFREQQQQMEQQQQQQQMQQADQENISNENGIEVTAELLNNNSNRFMMELLFKEL